MASVTPMMQQYIDLKEKYSDCLLFFRLGDFYEMFFDDAITASRELDIVLTGRDCGLSERAPMCGVPYHAVNTYINKLIEKGYKVAICEQLIDPKEAKGLVDRDVIRVITPGTVIEETMLDERKNNFIVSVFLIDDTVGLAYCDVSTGAFTASEFGGEGFLSSLYDELTRIQPNEVILNDALFLQEQFIKRLQSQFHVERLSGGAFERDAAQRRLSEHFGNEEMTELFELDAATSAAGALLCYLSDTQKNALVHIQAIKLEKRRDYMLIDASTRRNLELTRPLQYEGSKRSTLLHVIDRTNTAMGGRLLRAHIEQPLQDAILIDSRLDAVEELSIKHPERKLLMAALDSIYDIERLSSRIAYGSVNARDCDSLRTTLGRIPSIIKCMEPFNVRELKRIMGELEPMEDIYSLLCSAIIDSPPLSVKEGGIIREGYSAEVDSHRSASTNGKDWIAKLEATERENTGIKNLRVGFNKVFGYYIEISRSYADKVPYTYQRKQTLANCERYITPELKELEETILGAEEKCIDLEYKLFLDIRQVLVGCIDRLQKNALLIAELDVYCSHAETAFECGYHRPRITNDGVISIKEGRHPVVERSVEGGFVPNSTLLDGANNRLLIITGPNMAGKSTYMRQVALITLMAHIGSFVPATEASISVTDRIFTRVGASDNLASGQSTFMVEMSEMANILKNATRNSLIIVDEIGRGTSTFDGLSIAWSVLEHISDIRKCGAKTLFATHYHELTELEDKLNGVKNYRILVKEIGDDIIFLRRIVRGGADKSFGVQVARLAGLPDSVIERAKEILKQLENADINQALSAADKLSVEQQLTMFTSSIPEELAGELAALDINELSPMEALKILYDMHIRAKAR